MYVLNSGTMASRPARGVSMKHILLSEILSVTTVMRKNSRWASSSHSFTSRDSALASSFGLRRTRQAFNVYIEERASTEQELMIGFQDLRRLVKDVEGTPRLVTASVNLFIDRVIYTLDLRTFPLTTLLAPFFAIIRSPLSTGPITCAALAALHSFFLCDLISSSSISLSPALAELSGTVSRCKFEASDSSGDEVALLKIMTVIHDTLCGSVGSALGDVEVCEMLETVLTTCCQMRLSGEFPPSSDYSLPRISSRQTRNIEALSGINHPRSGQDCLHEITRS